MRCIVFLYVRGALQALPICDSLSLQGVPICFEGDRSLYLYKNFLFAASAYNSAPVLTQDSGKESEAKNLLQPLPTGYCGSSL